MDRERLIRVGVTDNDPLALDMLVAAAGRVRGCVVLWRAMSGVEALQLVTRALRGRGALPDVMVVDVSLGDISGLQVCRRIRGRAGTEGIGMVGVTAYSADRFRDEARAAGMDVLMGKEEIGTGLGAAIAEAARRRRTGAERPRGLDDENGRVRGNEPDAGDRRPVPDSQPLSARELETLRHYARGMSTEEITRAMGVGPTTVYSYRNRALAKLGAHSLLEAIHLLTRRGAL
ncbi:response regulator transcription factor [Bifidobacterium moraviense]|nr:LuxR C-terminal-related transcriptional regulator [Bifidobacterium sp. DSM 109958]